MHTTAQHQTKEVPYWNLLKDLSYEDKLAIVDKLAQSIEELEQRNFEEDWKRAVSVEEFRTLCHQRVKELYGDR